MLQTPSLFPNTSLNNERGVAATIGPADFLQYTMVYSCRHPCQLPLTHRAHSSPKAPFPHSDSWKSLQKQNGHITETGHGQKVICHTVGNLLSPQARQAGSQLARRHIFLAWKLFLQKLRDIWGCSYMVQQWSSSRGQQSTYCHLMPMVSWTPPL